MNNSWFQVAHSLFQAEKLFSWGWRQQRNLCFAECWIVWWWRRWHKSQICSSPCPYSCCPQSDSICRYLWIVVVLGVVGCLHCIAFSATFLRGTFFWQVPVWWTFASGKVSQMFSLHTSTCYSFTAVQVLVQCCVKKKRSGWSQLRFGSRGTHTILISRLIIVAPQLVVVVVFPRWTLWGSHAIVHWHRHSIQLDLEDYVCVRFLLPHHIGSRTPSSEDMSFLHFWRADAAMLGAVISLS